MKEVQEDLNDRASTIKTKWTLARNTLKQAKENVKSKEKKVVIKELEDIFKDYLKTFKFNRSSISLIQVSRQSLRPEQDGYNIVAESSASDYIRIIWAYTLALLKLASTKESVKHGGFVMFDEPRQHEASKESFANLIENVSSSNSYGGQAIFATSYDKLELEAACAGRKINLICFEDYLLKLDAEANSSRMEDLYRKII